MKRVEKDESKRIIGGGKDITGAFLNAFKVVVTSFFSIGQYLGGAIRRITSNKLCNL